jgi:hypothetical protein
VHHRAPSTTVRCGPSVHVDSDLYGSDERGARVQRQQRQHPLSLAGVCGHGRGVCGQGGVSHNEEEHGGETIEVKVCCTMIGGFPACWFPVRLLERPRMMVVALPGTTGCPQMFLPGCFARRGSPTSWQRYLRCRWPQSKPTSKISAKQAAPQPSFISAFVLEAHHDSQ